MPRKRLLRPARGAGPQSHGSKHSSEQVEDTRLSLETPPGRQAVYPTSIPTPPAGGIGLPVASVEQTLTVLSTSWWEDCWQQEQRSRGMGR